jgi:hypothetical protein
MPQTPADHTRAQQNRAHQAKPPRLQRGQTRAPRRWQALEQAVQERGLPEPVAEDVPWRLGAQQKRVGKICGMRFPPRLWRPQLS